MSENVEVEIDGSLIEAHCIVCGDRQTEINKGLGRALIAAFKTQHQHTPASSEREGQR